MRRRARRIALVLLICIAVPTALVVVTLAASAPVQAFVFLTAVVTAVVCAWLRERISKLFWNSDRG